MNVIFHFEWSWYFTDVCLCTRFMADSFRKSWHIWLTWLSSCHHQEESLEQIIIDYYTAYRLPQGITCSSRQRVKVWLVSSMFFHWRPFKSNHIYSFLCPNPLNYSTSPHKAHQSWCYAYPSKKKKKKIFFPLNCLQREMFLTHLDLLKRDCCNDQTRYYHETSDLQQDMSLRNGMYWDGDRAVDSIYTARLQGKSFQQKPSCSSGKRIYSEISIFCSCLGPLELQGHSTEWVQFMSLCPSYTFL